MREPRIGQQDGTYYLVLNRSCADLYEKEGGPIRG
jgi:hypothetical protein